ncbi:MAG: hypothetical protein ACLR0W_06400 [Lachnospira sp.]
MGEQKANQTEQDLNHVLKARRDKLAELAGSRKGSISDHKIRCNRSQHGDQGKFTASGKEKEVSIAGRIDV